MSTKQKHISYKTLQLHLSLHFIVIKNYTYYILIYSLVLQDFLRQNQDTHSPSLS